MDYIKKTVKLKNPEKNYFLKSEKYLKSFHLFLTKIYDPYD